MKRVALLFLVLLSTLAVACGQSGDNAQEITLPAVNCTLPSAIPQPTAEAPDVEAICPPALGQLQPPLARLYCSGPNGNLPSACLRPIYQGRLIAPAAASWNAMNAAYARSHGGARMYPLGSLSSYRSYAGQVQLYRTCIHPGWCAVPGRSNHGLGTTIDLGDGGRGSMRAFINAYGRHYGWSKACSDAGWEAWHLRWNPPCTGGQYAFKDPGPLGNAKPYCHRGVRVGKHCRNVLHLGSRGSGVRLAQRVLRNEGWCSVRVSGQYDGKTKRAVSRLQRRAGIRADGVTGQKTWRAIEKRRGGKSRCR